MFSSKIIKTDTHTDKKSGVRNFYLQQFPADDDGGDEGGDDRQATTIDAARIEAERLRVEARQEAARILEQSRKELQRLEKQAHTKGYEEGLAAGRSQGAREFQSGIDAVQRIAIQYEDLKERYYHEHQTILIDLALKIARKVIHQEVTCNPELILPVLRAAIRLAVEREKLVVRINPADLEVCRRARPDLLRQTDGITRIVFEPDESIGVGGAIIEYAFGEIDARIDQQFQEVETALARVCEEQDRAGSGGKPV